MSTPPVMTVTDELLAELEELAFECNQHGGNWYEPRHMAAFPEYSCDQDFVVSASPATITALTDELRRLRAENAELAKDAGRYCFVRELTDFDSYALFGKPPEQWSDYIDTAMASK